ncbi:MAG TPA: tRNA (N6-isopentenyl adenosine(37)-C2)-methylthiotransferase MiaB [Desulfotomaculum sp.]|nr:tRNA (N6-isopentenyl adenosine(37)-C2)-methylthiotransferase MiaB [Desulfotomaculum sp.]
MLQKEIEDLPLKYFILTFGCQMNMHDSEVMAGILENIGYVAAENKEQADVLLINTCCVRETAENKIFGLMGKLRKLKYEKPSLIIGIGGCMTQQEKVAEKIKTRFPFIDLIYGTENYHRLAELLKTAQGSQKTVLELSHQINPVIEGLPIKRASGFRAWVVVTYGCNNYCTYCIVPYVRRSERSRQPAHIILEVKDLVAHGYREITLLGQNVNSYGKDLEQPLDFAGLLAEVNKISGLDRIRFITSHPRDFNKRLIETISSCEKICEHIHLPVQAGSNHILKKMNRGYTREHFINLVESIRQSIPGVSITTDIMIGFPGESDKDFQDTLDLIEKIRFDSAFTFIYSQRRGTPAATMEGQLPDYVKSERIKVLIDIQNKISKEINLQEVGKKRWLLVEGTSKTNKKLLSGRTRSNKTVIFPGPHFLNGKIVEVEITEGKLTHLAGKWLDNYY